MSSDVPVRSKASHFAAVRHLVRAANRKVSEALGRSTSRSTSPATEDDPHATDADEDR